MDTILTWDLQVARFMMGCQTNEGSEVVIFTKIGNCRVRHLSGRRGVWRCWRGSLWKISVALIFFIRGKSEERRSCRMRHCAFLI